MTKRPVREYEPAHSRYSVHFVAERPPWIDRLGQSFQRPPERILDLGAGDGHNSWHLADVFPSSTIYSCDISWLRSRQARELNRSQVFSADATMIPLADGTFDLVVCAGLVGHVPDDRDLMREAHRILRKGGSLFVSEAIRLRGAVYFQRNMYGKMVLDPTHFREYGSREEFLGLVSEFLDVTYVDLHQLRMSVGRFVLRQLIRLGILKRDSLIIQRNRLLKLASRIHVPIPRYREIDVLAVKRP